MASDNDNRDVGDVGDARGDDLFESSKMSFGDHLDELRTCLVQSLIGLGIGFIISLIFANKIVQFVELPLKDGLKQFYTDRDSMRMQKEYGLNAEQVKKLRDFMVANQVTVELMMLERNQLSRLQAPDPLSEILGQDQPDPPAEDAAAESPGEQEAGEKDPNIVEIDKGEWEERPALVRIRVWKPLIAKIVALSAPEAFLIWVKAAVIGGFVLSCPWIFYQVWQFVAKGLYPHERKYVYLYIPFSVILFLSGAAMAFFVVFDYVLKFLFTFNASMGLEAEPRISEWLGFVLVLPVGFGIAFQLPLVMLLLHRIGMFSIQAYTSKWRLAVLVIFVLSMFLTPADPVSMLAMAGPLTGLYFLGIILCKFMPRSRNPYAEGYDPGEAS